MPDEPLKKPRDLADTIRASILNDTDQLYGGILANRLILIELAREVIDQGGDQSAEVRNRLINRLQALIDNRTNLTGNNATVRDALLAGLNTVVYNLRADDKS